MAASVSSSADLVAALLPRLCTPSPPPRPFALPSPDTLLLDLHPNAKMILGTRNIAFMHGPSHKALRKSFLALFTRKALGLYIEKQDAVIREHLALWMEDLGAQEMRLKVWAMNAETSQSVFVGEWGTLLRGLGPGGWG